MIKHEELVYGIPTLRSKKEEKYPTTAILTMLAEGEKGTAKKLDINTYAVEQLEFKLDGKDTANFAFNMEDGKKVVYFANTSNIENPTNINVTKQATFSNKKMYEYLAKVFELDTTQVNELVISEIEGNVGRVTADVILDLEAPTTIGEVAPDPISEAQVIDEVL